jgi:hypothetical protein
MMPTKERIKWLKLSHHIRMQNNSYTCEFLKEIEQLNIKGSLIKELKQITNDIPDIKEFTLPDRCRKALKDLEDENEEKIILSKTCQLLKLAYNINDRHEMRQYISQLI